MLADADNILLTRVGPGTPLGTWWRRFWVPTLLSSELLAPDCPPVRVRLLGEDLVAFRDTSGQVGLVQANCPHRGASLFFGRNEEHGLRCVYHGWKFDVSGYCVDMPNEPEESNFKTKVRQVAYPCQERAGLVWAYLGPSHLSPELPDIDWALVPPDQRRIEKLLWECNWLQQMEGDVDNSHVNFLHAGLGGSVEAPVMDRVRAGGGVWDGYNRVRRTDALIRPYVSETAPRPFVKYTDYGIMTGWRRPVDDGHWFWHVNQWLMPGYALLGRPPGATLAGIFRVPADDSSTWYFQVRWNPHRPLVEADWPGFPELIPGTYRAQADGSNDYFLDRPIQRSESFSGIRNVENQDRAVTESMGPIVNRAKQHLGTSDTAIIAMRRRLLREVRALEAGQEPYAAAHGEVYRIRAVDIALPRDANFEEGARDLMKV